MKELLIDFFKNHATKVIGYLTIAAAFFATADPQLVGDLLGPNFTRWALLISGLLMALRGHTNPTRRREPDATTEGNAR